MDAVELATAILRCPDEAVFDVLSLAPGLPPVTAETAVADARRNYMRLAGLVHPDKLKDSFEKATEVFQKLVHVFEMLADPKSRKRLLAQQAKQQKQKEKEEARKVAKVAKAAKSKVDKSKSKRGGSAKKAKKVETEEEDEDDTVSKPAKNKKHLPKKSTKKSRGATYDDEDEDDDFIDDDEDEYTEDSDSDADADDEDEDEEDADDLDGGEDRKPNVSSSRTPIGKARTGAAYKETTVACPHCRTQWEPDNKQQYSLFMGPAGKRVLCHLCLIRFGCATAMHACPHCQATFDYDASMYDGTVDCRKCKKQFGFPYYPVNQQLIDLVRLEEWRERQELQRARERDERAASRRRRGADDEDGNGASEKLHQLLGECVVNEQCPLCRQRVNSHHRQHLEECMKKPAAERKQQVSGQKPQATKKTPTKAKPSAKEPVAKAEKKRPAPKAVTKAAPKAATKATSKPAKKRRRDDSSESDDNDDDDDDDDDYSESEPEDESESELDSDDD